MSSSTPTRLAASSSPVSKNIITIIRHPDVRSGSSNCPEILQQYIILNANDSSPIDFINEEYVKESKLLGNGYSTEDKFVGQVSAKRWLAVSLFQAIILKKQTETMFDIQPALSSETSDTAFKFSYVTIYNTIFSSNERRKD